MGGTVRIQVDIDEDVYPELYGHIMSVAMNKRRAEKVRALAEVGLNYKRDLAQKENGSQAIDTIENSLVVEPKRVESLDKSASVGPSVLLTADNPTQVVVSEGLSREVEDKGRVASTGDDSEATKEGMTPALAAAMRMLKRGELGIPPSGSGG